ncbi:tRNA (cytidine(34)-2'-O)-methyltransferase [uncultured archaeon]|nr:tRNA (cytidine(34)-2'-O)-methyltransferase [uncultured archaeon]
MKKELILLFDTLRDPRDLAEVIHLGLAFDIEIELTGNSIQPTHVKVINILDSWIHDFRDKPQLDHISIHSDFSKRITALKKQGYKIIGTSSTIAKAKPLSKYEFGKGKYVIVFGTETSGLSAEKQELMDEILSVPMKNKTRFFTVRAVAPILAFEALRQKGLI